MSNLSMTKKRKRDDLRDDYSGGIEDEMTKLSHGSKKRNTIDSDSEDEVEEDYNKKKHSVLKDEDIEGQEDLEEEYEQDGETKITPFNMKDEMEEGYFDGQGTYIWNKRDGSEVKDNWLDSVDWMKLKKETAKEKEERKIRSQEDSDSDSSLDYMQLTDKSYTTPLYKECLSMMKPGENILKAIKRHSPKVLSASERLKLKKLAKLKGEVAPSNPGGETSGGSDKSDNPLAVTRLTEIANKFISLGDMGFYQETFESMSHKVENLHKPPPNSAQTTLASSGDGVDMFSD